MPDHNKLESGRDPHVESFDESWQRDTATRQSWIMLQRYTDEKQIWDDAWRIIDPGASNPTAVAGTLTRASSFIVHAQGTDAARKHPALRCMAGQLAHLFHVDYMGPSQEDIETVKREWDATHSLANETNKGLGPRHHEDPDQ